MIKRCWYVIIIIYKRCVSIVGFSIDDAGIWLIKMVNEIFQIEQTRSRAQAPELRDFIHKID